MHSHNALTIRVLLQISCIKSVIQITLEIRKKKHIFHQFLAYISNILLGDNHLRYNIKARKIQHIYLELKHINIFSIILHFLRSIMSQYIANPHNLADSGNHQLNILMLTYKLSLLKT